MDATTQIILWKIVVPLFFFVLSFLIGIVWKQLNNKIDKIETISTEKISKIEQGVNAKVSKENCDLERQLMTGKIENLHYRITENITQNTKEHTELQKMFLIISEKQDKTHQELSDIHKCLALLSENVRC